MRHTIKIAVMIVAVVGAVMSGLALAQTDDTDTTPTYQSWITERLAGYVEDGTITQAQADALAEGFSEDFAERRAAQRDRFEQRQTARQELLDLLGMTQDEFREAVTSDLTLAEIAQQQGTTADAVIDLMVSNAQERLDAAVEDGKLTQEEANEKLVEITEKITDTVNNGGELGRRFGGGRHWRGHGEFGGFGTAGATDAVNT